MRKRNRSVRGPQPTLVIVLVVIALGSIIIVAAPSLFAELVTAPDGGGTSSQITLQVPGTDGGNNGTGGNSTSNDCVLATPCMVNDASCKPSFQKISCDDPACVNSPAFCVAAPTVSSGTSGNGGGSNDTGGGSGGSNDCVLATMCSPLDPNCTPTFQKISCSDPSCVNNTLCLPAPVNPSSTDNGHSNGNGGNTDNGNSNGNNTGGDNGTSGGQNNTAGDGKSGQTNIGGVPPSSLPSLGTGGSNKNGNILGCFASDGTWTTDRTACDPNQLRHMQKQPEQSSAMNGQTSAPQTIPQQTSIQEDQQDQALQSRLDSAFHTQQERDSAYATLVNAATTALTHLQTLSQQQLPPAAAASVTATSDWLKQLLGNLSGSEPTVSDMQQQSAEMKSRLQDMQSILASTVTVTPPKPQDLTDPIEKILDRMPSVFQFLTTQGVQLSAQTAAEYTAASTLYTQEKSLCLQNSDNCLQMQDVITHLSTMRDDLVTSLTQQNKINLESQIDQMLQ